MIYLYDSHTTDFTYNGQPLPKSYDVVVRRFINGEYFVTWKHSIDKEKVYKAIQKDKIITAHTPDGMQPFRIMEPVKTMDYVEFEAWPLLYADMRNKLVRPISLRNATGQQAISAFLNNLLLDTPFVFTINITTRHDYHTQSEEERENNPNQLYDALEVFKDIVSRWNGELIINGYDIRIVNRIGVDKQALLYEKKNINNYLDRESISGIVTRLYGKSEWVEYLEGGESINHNINISVDSPLIDSYNGIIFEKQYTNNDIRSEQEMRNWLNLKFTSENIDKPNRSIELDTNIVDDEEIHLGDGLVLKYLKHDVDMQIRMIGYDFDGYANRYLRAYLGDAKASFVGSISNTVSNVQNDLRQETDHKTHVILNRQGVKVIYSPTEPTGDFRTDDIWFDNDGGMYKYDSERSDWIPHPYNRRSDIVKQMVEEQQKDIESAQSAADTANQQINDAINAAGFSTLADLTADIQSISTRADANALAARDNALSASTTAESAMTLATDLSGQVSDFELTVNGFNQTVNNYTDQVAQFTSDVNGLNSTVASYETQVDEFGNTVSTYTTQVSQFENTVNGLNSTVSSYQSDVQGYEAQVSTLTNTVDGFNATVESVQADYSGLSGTVQSLGASIGVVEGQITNRVWQTDIQTAVDDIEVGGRNLMLNSELKGSVGDRVPKGWTRKDHGTDYEISELVVSPWDSSRLAYHVKVNHARSYIVPPPESRTVPVKEGENIVISVKATSTVNMWYSFHNENGQIELSSNARLSGSVDRKFITVKVPTGATELQINRIGMGTSGSRTGDVIFEYIKVEEGNKATDWTPAPEDTMEVISHVESELTQKYDSITATVSSLDGRFAGLRVDLDSIVATVSDVQEDAEGTTTLLNQTVSTVESQSTTLATIRTDLDGKATVTAFNTLESTVNGTIQRIGDAEGNITQIEANVSGLQTTVASKASQTEVTQLATGFNVLSTNFNNLEIGGRNLARGTINSDFLIGANTSNQTRTMYARVSSVPLEAGTDYVVSFKYVISNSSNPSGTFRIQGSNPYPTILPTTSIESLDARGYLSAVFRLFSGLTTFSGFNFRFDNFTSGARFEVSDFKIEKGNKATDWTPAPEDMATQAQLSVLNDQINLRVKEGDVMSQINIEAGRTLIESERLYLDAESVIFSGKAFIPDAAIETLTADKLTAGTIDADEINVINLNVNSLVGNRTDFVQSSWNDITNDIHISAAEGFVSTGHFTEDTHNGIPLDFFGQVKVRNGYIDMSVQEVGVSGAEQATAHLSGGSLSLGMGDYTSTVDPTGYYMYQGNTWLGGLSLETFDDGATGLVVGSGELRMTQNRLETLRGGNRHLYIVPSGTGRVMVRSITGAPYYPVQASQFLLENTSSRLRMVSGNTRLEASAVLQLYSHSNQLAFEIGSNINVEKNINMRGNTITNQSDVRLKHDIRDHTVSSLDRLNKLHFVDFRWNKDGREDFGLIAQKVQEVAPELISEDEGVLSINNSLLNMMTTHAIQELSKEHENTLLVASHAYLLAEQHEDEIDCLKRKVTELKEEIEELRGMCA